MLLVVIIVFLIIFLLYNWVDFGFIYVSEVDEICNLGGCVGVWLVDFLLFVFGVFVYWWVVLFVCKVWCGWCELMLDECLLCIFMLCVDVSVMWIGFVFILVFSMGLEVICMYLLYMKFLCVFGGVLGDVIGGVM